MRQRANAQFSLRAVLMHDGALVAGRHLYMYVRSDEGRWWRIQDHEVEEVSRGRGVGGVAG